jgi:hypothetical protein
MILKESVSKIVLEKEIPVTSGASKVKRALSLCLSLQLQTKQTDNNKKKSTLFFNFLSGYGRNRNHKINHSNSEVRRRKTKFKK